MIFVENHDVVKNDDYAAGLRDGLNLGMQCPAFYLGQGRPLRSMTLCGFRACETDYYGLKFPDGPL